MDYPSTTRPTDVTEERSWFDRVADTMTGFLARAPYFLTCVTFCLVWLAVGPLVGFSHHWIDTMQTVAAVVTFLMVALLENEGWRSNKATQRKLNAIASALAEVMEKSDVSGEEVRQLNAAVGLEKRESATQ